jgi:hypothetical protein
MMWAVKGVISEGLWTIVFPVASAGTILHMIWLMGQFHGVICGPAQVGQEGLGDF